MLTALTMTIAAGAVSVAQAAPDRALTPVEQLRVDLGLPASADDGSAGADDAPAIIRLAGDPDAMPESVNGYQWRFGDMFIETALPDGYPRPTPPGVIEVKRYPSVRRAEVTGTDMRGASNRGFFPLFQHITNNDIAMTAPVEMDLPGWSAVDDTDPESWTMSFLYRTRDLRETGTEGNVIIRDTEPVTVIAIGLSGAGSGAGYEPYLEKLEEFLADNDEWRAEGDPRWFGYNGPMTRPALRWGEVQIPVARIETTDEADKGE
ncbi:MAG: heme-binding protein [Planctomycetota bacterium]